MCSNLFVFVCELGKKHLGVWEFVSIIRHKLLYTFLNLSLNHIDGPHKAEALLVFALRDLWAKSRRRSFVPSGSL